MLKSKYGIIILFIFVISSIAGKNIQPIDLSGKWGFAIDSLDAGVKEKWFSKQLNDNVILAGSMNGNGKGNDISLYTKWTATNWSDSSWHKRPDFAKYRQPENVKVSFWLSPNKIYVGAAWYQKEITIPANWKSKQIFLHLERCHWETSVWVDNKEVGMKNSLSTPHVYNLTEYLSAGPHTLSVRVDNRVKEINPGLDAHSISDNTQTNWNGIIGKILLLAKPNVLVSKVNVFPNLKEKNVRVELTIENHSKSNQSETIEVSAIVFNSNKKHKVQPIHQKIVFTPGTNQATLILPMGDNFLTWDEFSPSLYHLKAEIKGLPESSKTVSFGMREIKPVGTQFQVNGKPIFLRGTLECAIFPLTGYPPADIESWKRIMKQMQNHGLNHIRFHSWCPPGAAFDAADEMGMYLQVESPVWAHIGDSLPIDDFIYKESNRIVEEYGNHPSFCLMAYGNEPHGKNHVHFLKQFVAYWKNKDDRRVYTSGAGWPELAENNYHNIPAPRIQHWNDGLKSIINGSAPQTIFDYSAIIDKRSIPVVSHEIGQWCVFPNFDEIKKYTGVLKPKNFELFKEDLSDHHMGDQAHDFLMASGKLQALCYKADIEASLRSKGMAGFQLLDLHDFPGQGTALVGVLDVFWEEKGYIAAKEFAQFCNKVVPLARMNQLVYSSSDTLIAEIELANFSGETLKQARINWEIIDDKNTTVTKGDFQQRDFPIGNALVAGKVSLPLTKMGCPAQYKIRISVDGTVYTNQWDFWVYPAKLPDNTGNVFVTDKFDEKTIQLLTEGKNVLLTVNRSSLRPEKGGNIDFGFSTVFWNTSWTKNQAPHTLGILCNPKHPAFADFPTEYHTNWQWWDIISQAGAMDIDDFPADYKPLVQPIHTWFDNKKLALIIEAKVLNGRLLMASVDLTTDMEKRLPSRQLKYSLLKYMNSEQFNPGVELNVEKIKGLLIAR